MTRTPRHGVTVEAQLDELLHTLALVRAELEHLEAETDRYRTALREIASFESGSWGLIAQAALHPPAGEDAA